MRTTIVVDVLVLVLVLAIVGCRGSDSPKRDSSEPATSPAAAAPIDPAVSDACDRIWHHRVDWWMATVGGTRVQAEQDLDATKGIFTSECPRLAPATRSCMLAATSSAAYNQCQQTAVTDTNSECARLWQHRLDLELAAGTPFASDRTELAHQMKPTADVFLAACPGYSSQRRVCLAAATALDAFKHCH